MGVQVIALLITIPLNKQKLFLKVLLNFKVKTNRYIEKCLDKIDAHYIVEFN